MLSDQAGPGGWLLAVGLWLVVATVPGLLAVTALRPELPRVDRWAIAPAVSIAVGYVPALWVSTRWPSAGLTVLALSLLVVAVSSAAVLLVRRRRGPGARSAQRHDLLLPLVGVTVIGVVLGLAAIGRAATSWSTVVPNDDGGRHGALVARVLMLGSVHPLDLETTDLAAGVSTDGFYPTGLHAVAALVATVVGAPTALVVAAVVAAAVWAPLGVYALARRWTDARSALVAATVLGLLLVVFPSAQISWGGWPLIVGLSLVPATVLALDRALPVDAGRGDALVAAAALVGVGVVHPPEAVAAGLVATLAAVLGADAGRARLRRVAHLAVVGAVGAAVLAPVVLAQLGGSSGYGSDEVLTSWGDAVMAVVWFPTLGGGDTGLGLATALSAVGLLLLGAAVSGCVRLFRTPGARGLVVAIVLFAIAAVLASQGLALRLTAPWYGQSFRLLAQAWTLATIPVGVGAVAAADTLRRRMPGRVGAALVVALAAACAVPLLVQSSRVADDAYTGSVVTAADRAAFAWLAQHTAPGERVLNDPKDGSVWAYALTDGRVAPVFGPKPLYGWAHYPDWSERLDLLDGAARIPSDPGLTRLAEDWDVRYVLVGERTFDSVHRNLDLEALTAAPGVTEVFRSGAAHVFQVRR